MQIILSAAAEDKYCINVDRKIQKKCWEGHQNFVKNIVLNR